MSPSLVRHSFRIPVLIGVTNYWVAGKLKGLFGNGASSDEENASEEEPSAREESTSSAPAASPSPAKKTEGTIPLEFKINLSSIPPMSVAEKRTARDRSVKFRRPATFPVLTLSLPQIGCY